MLTFNMKTKKSLKVSVPERLFREAALTTDKHRLPHLSIRFFLLPRLIQGGAVMWLIYHPVPTF